MKSTKRKLPLQKAARGLHEVTVPPTGNGGDVLNSAVQGGLSGSQFGPWGAAAGAVGGLALGAFQKKGQDAANKAALEKNSFVGANTQVSGVDPTTGQRTTYAEGTQGVKSGKKPLSSSQPTRQDSVVMATQGFPLKSYYGPKREVAEAEGKQALTHYQQHPSSWTRGIQPTGYQVKPNAGGGYDMGLTFPYPQSMQAPAPDSPGPVASTSVAPGKKLAYQSRGGFYDQAPGKGFEKFREGTEATQASKPIEVEKDELVFRKVGGRFKLKADFQGGKSHKQGGEPYQAQEGDIIFPGKQRKKVLSHLKEGNHRGLEGMRQKLPQDTNPQGEAELGANFLSPGPFDLPTQPLPSRYAPGTFNANRANRYGAYGAYQDAMNGLGTGKSQYFPQDPLGNYQGSVIGYQDPRNKPGQLSYYRYNKPATPSAATGESVGFVGNYRPTTPSISTPEIPSIPSMGTTPSESKQEGEKGAGLGNALQYASVANNLIQGFSPAEQVQENYLDPTLLSYSDRSDPQRRASRQAAVVQGNQARAVSGGNVGNVRANQAQAVAEDVNRRQAIDNGERERWDGVQEFNTQQVARTKEINSQKHDQYAQLNAQARANQQAYKDAAFSQLSSLGQAKEQEGYMRERDAKLDARDNLALKYLNQSTHYTTPGDGTIQWNPQGSGYLGGYGSTTTSQKVDQDVYGRTKTSTTTTSKSNPLGIKRKKK